MARARSPDLTASTIRRSGVVLAVWREVVAGAATLDFGAICCARATSAPARSTPIVRSNRIDAVRMRASERNGLRGAVSDLLDRNSRSIEDGQQHVRDRGVIGVAQVLVTFHSTIGAADGG